jgi:hypothetical protein
VGMRCADLVRGPDFAPNLEILPQRTFTHHVRTLPHRFQVIPHGIHMETWIPGGISLQATQPNYCPIPHGFQVGYNTGAGKTAVILMRVSRLQVQCDFLSPVATPYPLSRYHGLGRVFIVIIISLLLSILN